MTTNKPTADNCSATTEVQPTTTDAVVQDLADEFTANGADGEILRFDEFSAAFDATQDALEAVLEEVQG